MLICKYLNNDGMWTVVAERVNSSTTGVLKVKSDRSDRYMIRAIDFPDGGKRVKVPPLLIEKWKSLAEDFINKRGEFAPMGVSQPKRGVIRQ